MFISIKKGIFEDDNVTEEINTSIKLFEDKMNQMKVPEINRTLKVAPLQITEPVTINNSIMIENQIVLFCQVPPSINTLTINESIAPKQNIEVRVFSESMIYGTASIDTKGKIRLSSHTVPVWIYATWIVARNSII